MMKTFFLLLFCSSVLMGQVQKRYFPCRFGQLHVRMYADAATLQKAGEIPLICFHHSPSSGHIFEGFMREMGQNRVVIAPDTPGFGNSDTPQNQPDIADYAEIMNQLLDQLGYAQVDVLGYHTGGLIAIELAIKNPQRVRKVVVAGLACFNENEQKAFMARPWPAPIKDDGSHLAEEWQRSLAWKPSSMSTERMAEHFAVKLRVGPKSWWGARAALFYPTLAQLPKVKQPLMVIRPKDDLWEVSMRAKSLIPNAQWVDWPQYGFWIFDVAIPEIVSLTKAFYQK
jgi:pimeloyl-ACP methyl ester carboxylesterase